MRGRSFVSKTQTSAFTLIELLVVVVMTPLVLLGVPRINIWIIRGVEERRQRRLEARRRRRWLARGG